MLVLKIQCYQVVLEWKNLVDNLHQLVDGVEEQDPAPRGRAMARGGRTSPRPTGGGRGRGRGRRR